MGNYRGGKDAKMVPLGYCALMDVAKQEQFGFHE